eukprot:CAMPEP_0173333230 /NCGR_PEP_ID=MMETSP1144-20121109/4763_1 /TAXON_ID=483371 /ORGANISM="non described non described, Strain CCMP2298" /LENGTH=1288 /DNA_ID=CAMNT_0014278143 /DNA_START=84 /DNA_END=3950 /DNA_ORIENTATION=+
MADTFEMEFEAQVEALAIVDAMQRERDSILSARRANTAEGIAALRKQNASKKQLLKSDLKKSNAFVKKLRSINSEGIQQCARDTETLNLTLFISEIVNAVVATTYKAVDASNMVRLCICIHQKYEEFCTPLVSGLKQALLSPPEDDPDAGKRKRIQIRFLVELFQAGLFDDEKFFLQLLKSLLGRDRSSSAQSMEGKSRQKSVDLQGLGTFVKYGSEALMGFVPRRVSEVALKAGKPVEEMPLKLLCSAATATEARELVETSYQQLCRDLIQAYQDYLRREAKMEKDRLIHGTGTEQKQAELDKAKKLYEKLLSIVSTISECTAMAMPVLQVEKEEEDGTGGLSVWADGREAEDPIAKGGLHGDPESRAFYEDLPDLLAAVPLTVLGLTPEQAQSMREKWEKEALERSEAVEEEADGEDEAEAPASESKTEAKEGEAEDGVDESKYAKLLTLLTEKLPESVNKAKADEFCASFCYLATKNARKKLVQALVRIPRQRLELAPNYARIVASLSRLYPEIGPAVMDALKSEFFGILRAKTQVFFENKIKSVRFLAELVKFRVAPPITAFRMLKALLGDFSNHGVQLLAVLLETCGRFLYLLPYTRDRMEEVLKTVLRLRRVRNLDPNMQTVIEAAYFAVKPPERVQRAAKRPLTPVQQYVRYLVLERVGQQGVSAEGLIKSLRRLPWEDEAEQVQVHVVKAALKVARTKYVSLPHLADCLSGLASHRPDVVTALVDRVWEEVQRGMETPHKREIQRMLGLVRLLGELYNFTAVSGSVVFDLLYHLVNHGHALPETLPASASASAPASAPAPNVPLSAEVAAAEATQALASRPALKFDPRWFCPTDAPTDLFRAQVVCELLNTCGLYYVAGKARDRLSRFLVFFQRYLLTKRFVPLHVEFTLLDTLDQLEQLAREAVVEAQRLDAKKRGGAVKAAETQANVFPRFETYEAAQAAVDVYETAESVVVGTGQGVGGVEADLDEEEQEDSDEDDDEEDDEEEEEGEDEGEEEEGSDSEDDGADSEDERRRQREEQDEAAAQELRSEQIAARMMEKLRIAEEDDEFESAFKHVMQESVSAVSAKSSDLNKMVIPAVLPKPKNAYARPQDDDGLFDREMAEMLEETGPRGQAPKGITFKLLSRDSKGRFETRQLQLPEDSSMALKLAKAEEQQRAEKQYLKERVLQLEQLAAETELGGVEAEHARQNAVAARGSARGGRSTQPQTRPLPAGAPQPAAGSTAGGSSYSQSWRNTSYSSTKPVRTDERKAPESNSLNDFLAETNASELRKVSGKRSGRL